MPAAGIATRPYRPLPPREGVPPPTVTTPLSAAGAATLPQQPYQPLPPRTDIRPSGMAGQQPPSAPQAAPAAAVRRPKPRNYDITYSEEQLRSGSANPRQTGRLPGEKVAQFNRRIRQYDDQWNNLNWGEAVGPNQNWRALRREAMAAATTDAEREGAWSGGVENWRGGAQPVGGLPGGGAGYGIGRPGGPIVGGTNAGGGAAGQDPPSTSGPPTTTPEQTPWSLDTGTEDYIRQLLSGEGGPYTGEVVGGLTADAAARRSADLANTNRNLTLAAARGGVAGPAQQALAASAERDARGGLSSDVTGIKREATLQNHAARVQGLQAGLAEVANRRARDIARAENDTQREAIARRYEAEMADIQARLQISQNELSQQERLQQEANAAAARGGSAAWDRELQMFNLRNERSDFEYNRDLPFQLYQYGQQAVGDNFVY